ASVTRLRFVRFASLTLACSQATFARRQKTTFRGCFLSSGSRVRSVPCGHKKTPLLGVFLMARPAGLVLLKFTFFILKQKI
ncbi:MAG: hypothetical protein IJ778_00090, partial [Alphaproteobacteria bacterium]|nr:hypothetical protein [Alphaproteobacteria bacterium]